MKNICMLLALIFLFKTCSELNSPKIDEIDPVRFDEEKLGHQNNDEYDKYIDESKNDEEIQGKNLNKLDTITNKFNKEHLTGCGKSDWEKQCLYKFK